MTDLPPPSSEPLVSVAYAHATTSPDVGARADAALQRIGVGMLVALLSLLLIESISAAAVTIFDYGSPRVPPAFILYLGYLAASVFIAILCLRRTWHAPMPLSPADERAIRRNWLWLALLRLTFLGGYTVIVYLASGIRAPAPLNTNVMIAARSIAYAVESVLPMLLVPLLLRRRPLVAWVAPLAWVFLAYGLIRVTLELLPLVALAMSEEAAMLKQSLRRLTTGFPFQHPLGWLVLAMVAAAISLRKIDRWLLRTAAVGATIWLCITYRFSLFGPGNYSLVALLATAYTLYNAVLALAPAWLLGWLSFAVDDGRPRRGEPLLAEPADAPQQ